MPFGQVIVIGVGIMEDEQIKKVIEEYRNSKVGKVFKDPKKAEMIGILSIFAAIYMVAILVFVVSFPDVFIPAENEKWQEFKDISISNMDCYGLRKTLLDLEKSEQVYQNIPDQIERQIIARCLG